VVGIFAAYSGGLRHDFQPASQLAVLTAFSQSVQTDARVVTEVGPLMLPSP
jgi:hypothetical protein